MEWLGCQPGRRGWGLKRGLRLAVGGHKRYHAGAHLKGAGGDGVLHLWRGWANWWLDWQRQQGGVLLWLIGERHQRGVLLRPGWDRCWLKRLRGSWLWGPLRQPRRAGQLLEHLRLHRGDWLRRRGWLLSASGH